MLKYFTCCLVLLITAFSTQAQEASVPAFLDCIEQYYGSSNLLVNGPLYQQENTAAAGSPYLKETFQAGTIYINGQAFKNEMIKYNLDRDALILEKELNNGTRARIVLDENTVDSFSIDEHLFVSKPLLYASKKEKGYLEKVLASNTAFYFTQKKYFEAISSGKYPNGRYLTAATKIHFKKEHEFQVFSRQKEFLAYFDSPQKALRNLMRREKIKLKKASKAQLIQLVKIVADVQ